jgi:hypothetical protein
MDVDNARADALGPECVRRPQRLLHHDAGRGDRHIVSAAERYRPADFKPVAFKV